jgi:hypothetical protein
MPDNIAATYLLIALPVLSALVAIGVFIAIKASRRIAVPPSSEPHGASVPRMEPQQASILFRRYLIAAGSVILLLMIIGLILFAGSVSA